MHRYKYLQKPLETTSLPTLLQYVNRWDPVQKEKFAMATGLLMAQGLAGAACLLSLTKDQLVKNGVFSCRSPAYMHFSIFFLRVDIAVNILTLIFRAYLAEQSMESLAGILKRGGIKDLSAFFPPNRRDDKVLDEHFRKEGLPQVADWWTKKQNALIKEDITNVVRESLEHEEAPSNVSLLIVYGTSCHRSRLCCRR